MSRKKQYDAKFKSMRVTFETHEFFMGRRIAAKEPLYSTVERYVKASTEEGKAELAESAEYMQATIDVLRGLLEKTQRELKSTKEELKLKNASLIPLPLIFNAINRHHDNQGKESFN